MIAEMLSCTLKKLIGGLIMVNIIVCMFVADVVMVFVAFVSAIILALYRLVTKQYSKLEVPATMSAGLRVKEKATQNLYDVYDTKHEDGNVGFMIYKEGAFKWVSANDFEPAAK